MLQRIFFNMVLPNGVTGSIFIILILAFRRVTEKWTKKYVRILWLLLLVQLLAPPLLRSSFYTMRDLGAAVERTEKGDVQKDGTEDGVLPWKDSLPDGDAFSAQTAFLPDEGLQTIQTSLSEGQAGRDVLSPPDSQGLSGLPESAGLPGTDGISRMVAFIWFAGTMAILLFYIVQYRLLRRRVAGVVKDAGKDFRLSAGTTVPFVMPGIPPRIYLPEGLTEAQQEDVLAHERQHIRNMDPLIKCIALIAAAVYWFHPLVWLAVLMLGKDMEMYCDECAMRGRSLKERKAYSGTLLEFAAASSGLFLTINFSKSNTESRIQHILYGKKPRLLASILLTVFVMASGILFLTSKDEQDSEKETETETVQEDYHHDAQTFAETIKELLRNDDGEALADLIRFPMRMDVDGENRTLKNKEEFIEYYSQIANKGWKADVINGELTDMSPNFFMGDGDIWFSEWYGQDDEWGYWIDEINNDMEINLEYVEKYKEEDLDYWKGLAGEHGMPKEEAEAWYVRFVQDGIYESYELKDFRVTGWAWEDFDGNGERDLFLVLSWEPHQIYAYEPYDKTSVYGYINSRCVYSRGFTEFSTEGFLECEAKKSGEPGSSLELSYTVALDGSEKKQYLITFDRDWTVLSEQCPTETEEIMGMLRGISEREYGAAIPYEVNSQHAFEEDHVVLLDENQEIGVRVFGYESDAYGARGMVINYNGTLSCFDFTWNAWRMQPEIYAGDFDGDSLDELAIIYLAGAGTGVRIEGLRIFEIQKDDTLLCYEMPERRGFLKEQLEDSILFDREKGIAEIVKDGEIKQKIDISIISEYKGNEEKVDLIYSNFINIEITGDHILMEADLMLEWNDMPTTYMKSPENNTVEIEVIYRDGNFYLQIA